MDKAAYLRELKAHVGGKAFCNMNEFCAFFGCGKATARDLLQGVPYLPTGREKRYLIKDIVETLKAKEVVS